MACLWKKAAGSAANGAITGAVQGALIGSGAGLGVSLAANFVGGSLGSAAEQQISTGRVDVRKTVTSGITNAVSNAIYGTKEIGSFGNDFRRGAAAGAAVSGINYISDSLAPEKGAVYPTDRIGVSCVPETMIRGREALPAVTLTWGTRQRPLPVTVTPMGITIP